LYKYLSKKSSINDSKEFKITVNMGNQDIQLPEDITLEQIETEYWQKKGFLVLLVQSTAPNASFS